MEALKLVRAFIANLWSKTINRDLIGYQPENISDVITKEDVSSFISATLDENIKYVGLDGIAPPFILAKHIYPLIRAIIVHPDIGLNILRMIHAEQYMVWHRPIVIGESVNLEARILDCFDTPAGPMLMIKAIATSERGPIVEATTGLLVRNRKKHLRRDIIQPELERELYRLEIQTKKGQELAYASASGDTNLIHTNSFVARLAGFPGRIMHGTCVLAMACNALIQKEFSGDFRRLEKISCRFGAPAMPGEKLVLIAHETYTPSLVHFRVLSGGGRAVLKNGIFQYK